MRNSRTGIYVNHGISSVAGNQTHCILLKSHLDLFFEWQTMTLREQMKDLKSFVNSFPTLPAEFYKTLGLNSKKSLILESWTQLESYRSFLPQSVSALDRALFLTNLTSLIALLQTQLQGKRKRRAASSAASDS